MALSIDGTVQTGTATGTNTVAITTGLTYSNAGDIILVQVGAEWPTSAGATGAGSVSTVTSTSGLTFHKRSAVSGGQAWGGANNSAYGDCELWWAYAAAAHSADVITVVFNAAPHSSGTGVLDDATITAFAVTGFTGTAYQTAPWDSNVSIPTTAQAQYISAAFSTAGTSTTSASGMLISSWGGIVGGLYSSTPTGWTTLATTLNSSGTYDFQLAASYLLYSSAQSSLTVTWPAGSQVSYLLATDALAQAGGAAAVAKPRQAKLKQYLRR